MFIHKLGFKRPYGWLRNEISVMVGVLHLNHSEDNLCKFILRKTLLLHFAGRYNQFNNKNKE